MPLPDRVLAQLAPEPSRHGTPWADVPEASFADWGWQQRHRITDLDGLEGVLRLDAREQRGLARTKGLFRFGISPYYALLADRSDPDCPMRRQMLPSEEERFIRWGERADPLGEESREVVPNLVHRYPDRVLLLATDRCPVYCRFCTRRRIVGRVERQAPRALLAEAFDYIRAHPELREVIVSGGDALMMGDKQLDYILGEIRRAPHVEVVRIATRMPVTCPMRVTDALAETLARHGPVYVLTHFNHPRECTPSAAMAVDRLLKAGLPVWNQAVLLRGVNDDLGTLELLLRRLVAMRAVPYYLHQCDLAEGIEHFRTPLQTGIELIEQLRGRVSGLMIPKLCVDVPGGLGKVTVQPDWIVRREGGSTFFRTYTGEIGEYVDPTAASAPPCPPGGRLTAAPSTPSVRRHDEGGADRASSEGCGQGSIEAGARRPGGRDLRAHRQSGEAQEALLLPGLRDVSPAEAGRADRPEPEDERRGPDPRPQDRRLQARAQPEEQPLRSWSPPGS